MLILIKNKKNKFNFHFNIIMEEQNQNNLSNWDINEKKLEIDYKNNDFTLMEDDDINKFKISIDKNNIINEIINEIQKNVDDHIENINKKNIKINSCTNQQNSYELKNDKKENYQFINEIINEINSNVEDQIVQNTKNKMMSEISDEEMTKLFEKLEKTESKLQDLQFKIVEHKSEILFFEQGKKISDEMEENFLKTKEKFNFSNDKQVLKYKKL